MKHVTQRTRLRLLAFARSGVVQRAPAATRVVSPLSATRRRLALINLAVVSAILIVMAVAVYVVQARAVDQQVDGQLRAWAAHESPADFFSHVSGDGGIAATPNPKERAEHYEPFSPNLFSIALDAQGNVIYDPANLAAFGLPDRAAAQSVLSGAAPSTLVTMTSGTRSFRLLTVPLMRNGQIIGALQSGTSLEARQRQLSDLLLTLGIVGLGVLTLTALASLYLADRALAPLRLAFERQRQFAGAASHELRTPLAIVRSQAERVTRHLSRLEGRATTVPAATVPADELRALAADAGEIPTEVDYMARLVHDLLLLARDESDRRGLAWASVDLRALAEDVVGKTVPLATERGISLTVRALPESAASGAWSVRGDADRLRQLLLILLENAMRYTPAGRHITVEVRTSRGPRLLAGHLGSVQVVVRDEGTGIAAEHLPHIFEPFYHAGSPVTEEATAHRGAGLGLALARWIVTAHGGNITVASTPGQGSTFTVALPAREAEARAAHSA